MSFSDPKHILLEPYCVLCRSHALYGQHPRARPDMPEEPEPWEEEVLCFFGIPTTARKARRHHMFRFRAEVGDDEFFPLRDEATTALLDEARLKLCYGCPECDLEQTANFVHIPCLQLATLRLGRLSARLLCELAWLLRPVVTWRDAGHLLSRRSHLLWLPDSHVSFSTELGALVRDLRAGLPREIQSMVCSLVPVGLFSSLSCCLETLACVQDLNILGSDTRVREPLGLSSPIRQISSLQTISADVITILGESCLSRLTGDGKGRSDATIELSNRPIRGVQYALGAYGVSALRVHYQDGSASTWLGCQPRKWFKFLPGSDLSRLQVQSDGYKLLSLAFVEDESPREASTADTVAHMLWHHDLGPLADHKVSLFDTALEWAPVRGNSVSRYGQYFPLPAADGREHALTLFCSPGGVDAIQVDGDKQRQLGKPHRFSCPITFYLRPDEVVDSVYSVHRGSPAAPLCFGPFLLMQTSLGRCLYYGPYITPVMQFTRGHLSAFGNEATHRVKGLFTDKLASYEFREPSIGAVQEPRERPRVRPLPPLKTPAPLNVDIQKLPGFYWQGTFVGKAVLRGAQELTQQRVGDRVRGLLARFPDGRPVQIIGAWDPSQTDTMSTIFAAGGEGAGSLSSLTFVFSNGPARRRSLRQVLVNSADVLPEASSFKWERLGEELAWYFSQDLDSIEPWDGLDLEITATETSLARIVVE